ncbi:MAG: YabP/YqfC family sporulation protein [Clostridia bacterium]|nr:YabP/YqfC family sporulation protein [Clostridia bacterium]
MRKKHIKEIIFDKFDIPLSGIASIPNAQFVGDYELSIDACIGVKKYEPNEIIIRAKDYLLRVSGSSLNMMTFSGGRVTIRGFISSYQIEKI